MTNSLQEQAEEIIVTIDNEIQQVEGGLEEEALAPQVDGKLNTLLNIIQGVVNNVDLEAAKNRVIQFKQRYPNASTEVLVQKLIKDKCQQTGTVGAVTSGAGLIPGIGTVAAVVLGTAADIGATFKLQAELVLEIAHAYNYPLNEEEKRQLVLLITGVSAGTSALARKAGQQATIKLGEKLAEKSILKALPIIGVIASAGTNVLSTYIIGQRADAYFRLGPEALTSWQDSLRTITGVDERKITGWLTESRQATGAALTNGAGKVGEVGKTVGVTMVEKTKQAGKLGQKGVIAYINWVRFYWKTIFAIIGKILSFIWAVITFIPRRVSGLFNRKKRDDVKRKT
jgi:hypothetical protein